ncbi:class I SAM-dependent methyltransferase [Candidatus Woesearchaeota archaeon]|nr:class I SAM-dependent methyltransferase [Candidatus Woesearchaeota archaeon]
MTEFWKSRPRGPVKKQPSNFARRSLKLIKKKKLKTILDLGSGRSRDSIFFAQNSLIVTALDISRSGLESIQKEIDRKNIKNIKTVCQDLRKLNFPNNSFDVIYAHLSLHYFDDKTTTKIFNDLYKILKKKGLFFVKCKSTDDRVYGKGEKVGDNLFIYYRHLRHFFDKEYMREKLNKFKILSIKKTASVHRDYKSSFIEAVAIK